MIANIYLLKSEDGAGIDSCVKLFLRHMVPVNTMNFHFKMPAIKSIICKPILQDSTFGVFFVVSLNRILGKQLSCCDLRGHDIHDITVMNKYYQIFLL